MQCKPGYYGKDGERCTLCEAGRFCPGKSIPPSDCPRNAVSNAGSDDVMDCFCTPGTVGPPGAMCTICKADSYCPDGLTQKACPDGAYAPGRSDSKDDCMCPAGKRPNDTGDCTYCKENNYCPGASQMFKCPAGSISDPASRSVSPALESTFHGLAGPAFLGPPPRTRSD